MTSNSTLNHPKTDAVKMMVACINANGESDLFVCTVHCTAAQRANGDHYEMAEEMALEAGYEGSFVGFDPDEQRNLARQVSELDCPVPFALNDNDSGDNDPISGSLLFGSEGVSVSLLGHSDCGSTDDAGIVAWLDCWNGTVVLRVYADINEESPTHNIDLDGARNERRHAE